jgi:hypothetical protein
MELFLKRVTLTEPVTVRDIAFACGVAPRDVLRRLMGDGVPGAVNENATVQDVLAVTLAAGYGFEAVVEEVPVGFHTCEFCSREGRTPATSSGETELAFEGGLTFIVPDMLTHYVLEHHYQPPPEFVDAVLHRRLLGGHRAQAKGPGPHKGPAASPVKVGWLYSDDYPRADKVDVEFLAALTRVLREANHMGLRTQTRGL